MNASLREKVHNVFFELCKHACGACVALRVAGKWPLRLDRERCCQFYFSQRPLKLKKHAITVTVTEAVNSVNNLCR